MKPKSTYWFPTERSPWVVIYWGPKRRWEYVGFRERRSEARKLAKFVRQSGDKARVVRAWIPLK
jgi:hypothetical protein